MININLFTLVVHLVIFLTMVVVLNELMFKPILKVIDARKQGVEGNRHSAEHESKKADAMMADYTARIEEARKLAISERDKVRAEAAAAEDKMIKEARAQAGDKIAGLREKIAAEYQDASKQLKADSEAMGKDIAKRILGRAV